MAVYGNIENIDAIILAEVMAGARHIDGFSPTVETERTANGEKITITDKDAEHIFEILNGTALSARVEGKKAIFEADGSEYQTKDIADAGGHFTEKTVEGALSELADRCDDAETEATTPRSVENGGTGADNAESARANLGLALDAGANYAKMPDGTLIQWGIRSEIAVTQNVTVLDTITYPVEFLSGTLPRLFPAVVSSFPHHFFVSIASGGTYSAGKVNIRCDEATISQVNYQWLAVGRWKEAL